MTDDPGPTAQNLVISQVAPGMFIELYNNTDSPISAGGVTGLTLCAFPGYQPLAASALGTGSIPPRSYYRVAWPASFNQQTAAGGELALYTNLGNYTAAANVIDFVCWGTGNPSSPPTGDSRKTTAEMGMKWSGPCATAISSGGGLRRLANTDGTLAAHYEVVATPEGNTCTP